MTLKELQEKINAIAEDDFFHSCDVVIGDTWKVASGVRSVSIGELPPAAYGISELALYITPMTELKKKETPVKRPRRTFEEIIAELAENLGNEWSPYEKRGTGCFSDGWGVFLIVSKDGGFEIELDADYERSASWSFKPQELAAISAACTEIAENWDAEHGKEKADGR